MSLRNVLARMRLEIDELYSKANRGVQAVTALKNVASVNQNPAITTPGAATIVPFLGVKLTARASGVFLVTFGCRAADVAGDITTWTVTAYTDSVTGTPLTLPANASPVGLNCFADNSGAGIAPSAGATAGTVLTATGPRTIGTAGVGDSFAYAAIAAPGAPVARGDVFYATLSVTQAAGVSRALSQAWATAIELP